MVPHWHPVLGFHPCLSGDCMGTSSSYSFFSTGFSPCSYLGSGNTWRTGMWKSDKRTDTPGSGQEPSRNFGQDSASGSRYQSMTFKIRLFYICVELILLLSVIFFPTHCVQGRFAPGESCGWCDHFASNKTETFHKSHNLLHHQESNRDFHLHTQRKGEDSLFSWTEFTVYFKIHFCGICLDDAVFAMWLFLPKFWKCVCASTEGGGVSCQVFGTAQHQTADRGAFLLPGHQAL